LELKLENLMLKLRPWRNFQTVTHRNAKAVPSTSASFYAILRWQNARFAP